MLRADNMLETVHFESDWMIRRKRGVGINCGTDIAVASLADDDEGGFLSKAIRCMGEQICTEICLAGTVEGAELL